MSEIIIQHENAQEEKDFSKGFLTIPYNGPEFKEFIKSLLGKPQSITKKIFGNFEIHLADLQNFHTLVNQRITQQNKGNLIQFTATIYYNDKSTVTLNSIEELETYNEIKPIISEAVRLNWSYLIKFEDKKHPEKQEIELFILSSIDGLSFIGEDLPSFLLPTQGRFTIEIKHTARSFASDIESLLTNQIQSLIKKDNKYKKIVRKNSGKISVVFSLIFFLFSIITGFSVTRNFLNSQIENSKKYINSGINEKVNYIIEYMSNGLSQQHFYTLSIFLLISVIVSILLGVWIEDTASKLKEYSFVVTTRKSKDYLDETQKKQKYRIAAFCISIIISIGSGILGNYIFKFLTE